MTATMTEVSRETAHVFRAVARGEVVQVTEHGQPIAEIRPLRPRRRPPTDAEIDAAFARIRRVRQATWEEVRAETREE